MSDLTSIADAVTAQINSMSLGMPFTAIRTYTPDYDPVTDTGIKVFVVPIAQTMTDVSRSASDFRYTIMVGIYNKIGFSEDNLLDIAAIDGMLSFTAGICENFITNTKVENPDAFATDITNDPVFDPGSLDQHNLFATVIELKYQLIK